MFVLPYKELHHGDHCRGLVALELNGVGTQYPHQRKAVLKELTTTIQTGECIAILGPNGAGKSTLLKAIAGIQPLTAGSIKVFGAPLKESGHPITYLPQRSKIDWSFPVSLYRFVAAGNYIHLGWLKRLGKKEQLATQSILTRLGLLELAHRQIDELSTGQQQRALVARALLENGCILLLDEPFEGIDLPTQNTLKDIFEELTLAGKTLLVTTHIFNEQDKLYHHTYSLVNGQLHLNPPSNDD